MIYYILMYFFYSLHVINIVVMYFCPLLVSRDKVHPPLPRGMAMPVLTATYISEVPNEV
jgi:hypothetical protein